MNSTSPNNESIYDLARRLVAAGISVIPIRRYFGGKDKIPALPEGDSVLLGQVLATEPQLRNWFKAHNYGLAAKCGAISGGLECIDFDEPGLFEQWHADVEAAAPGLLARLVVVNTPKAGNHVWFRSAECGRNQILAKRPSSEAELAENPKQPWQKRIETRANGGYALLPGSPPECHAWNKPYLYSSVGLGDIALAPVISADERTILFDCCRAYTTYAEAPKKQATPPRERDGRLTPGNDFERRGSWEELLKPLGWQLERGNWSEGRLTRPGKDKGVSATLGYCRGSEGEPLLNVFTTSAGLDPGAYGLFRAYTFLQHRGDYSAAARALGEKGYGEQRQAKSPTNGLAGNKNATPGQQRENHDGCELIVRRLKGCKARSVQYLVEDRIPIGKVTMFAGEGGMGKSTLIRHLIACLTTGRAAFGLDYKPVAPCDVLLASVEDNPEDTIVPHLLAERAELGRTILIEGIRRSDEQGKKYEAQFDLRDLDLVLRYVKMHPEARVLIIDPILSFVGRAGVKENSSGEVRTLLEPLIALAAETGLAVILIAHLNKATNASAVNRILGATAFRDMCRVVWMVGKDPDDPHKRVMAHTKSNIPGLDERSIAFSRVKLSQEQLAEVLAEEEFSDLDEEGLSRIEKQLAVVQPLGLSESTANDLLGSGNERKESFGQKKGPSDSSEQAKCVKWIIERLGTEYSWLDAQIEAEAMKALGISNSVFRAAKKYVPGLNYKKYGFGRGSHYRIGLGSIESMPFGEHEGPTGKPNDKDEGPELWPQ